MNLKRVNRIYIKNQLEEGGVATLSKAHAHYLVNVLRKKNGDKVRVFNGNGLEYLAEIIDTAKNSAVIEVKSQIEVRKPNKAVSLCFAPIKGSRMHDVIEKATELGVTHFIPVITDFTIVRDLNIPKLQQIAIEASEQCERVKVPIILEPQIIDQFLRDFKGELHICNENQQGSRLAGLDDGAHIFIGPEGGFSERENILFGKYSFIKQVSLGNNILRADTAAIVATTLAIL